MFYLKASELELMDNGRSWIKTVRDNKRRYAG